MILTRKKDPELETGAYESDAEYQELVQRLGRIEHKYEHLLNLACDRCKYPYEISDQEEMNRICDICPLTVLERMITGEFPAGI